ncbi:hypothetical protein AFLA_006005 [Aspergillus flavus NRRL3357]|nr:hypothetical protein AFLA_006005 [Aspergillus flavus NRRL3357]
MISFALPSPWIGFLGDKSHCIIRWPRIQKMRLRMIFLVVQGACRVTSAATTLGSMSTTLPGEGLVVHPSCHLRIKGNKSQRVLEDGGFEKKADFTRLQSYLNLHWFIGEIVVAWSYCWHLADLGMQLNSLPVQRSRGMGESWY